MRLRVLETEAGTVLVLDGLTEQRMSRIAGMTRPNGEAPYVLGIVGDVDIPAVDRTSATDLMDMQTRINRALGRL